MIAYFAEPIDQDNSTPNEQWFRNTLVTQLLAKGWSVYRPATAWKLATVDRATSLVVEKANRAALESADLVVARLPEGVASVGVPMEIEFATRTLGIPAIVVGVGGVALLGNPLVIPVGGNNGVQFTQILDNLDEFPSKPELQFEHTGYLAPRSYDGDAGIDLTTSEAMVIPPRTAVKVPTGNRFAFPPGVWGWIVARSSTFNQHSLFVLPGIIDEGYTGELFASVYNTSDESVKIEAGDRICQIILFDNTTKKYQPVEVDAIVDRDRGSNGFGSTGKSRLA